MQKLVIASNNKHKIKEIKTILKPYFEEILSLKEINLVIEIEETGNTFYENAFLKAQTVSKLCGLPALADDSGLMVEALNGLPGVYSARFAGEPCNDFENNYKLLRLMENIENRRCKFVSDVVLYFLDGKTAKGQGECEGELLRYFDGNGGFGYDPLFYCNDLGKSFGLALQNEKDLVSHRFKALMELVKNLRGNKGEL